MEVERVCACECVCVRERERERERVCVCERERERERDLSKSMRSSDHLAPLLTSIPQNSWKSIRPDPSPSARSNALLFAIILSSSLRNAFRSKSLARADRAESRASLRPCPVLLSFPEAAPLSAPIIDNTRLRTRFAIPLALPAGAVWRSTNLSQISSHVWNVRRWRIHRQRAETKHVQENMYSLAGLGCVQ